jgi:hypothetical protein
MNFNCTNNPIIQPIGAGRSREQINTQTINNHTVYRTRLIDLEAECGGVEFGTLAFDSMTAT